MTVVWVGIALYEAIHDLSGFTWGTLPIQYNWVGLILVPLFFASAATVWSDQLPRYRTQAFGVAIPFVHGLTLLTYEDSRGWIFAIAAVALGIHVYAVRKLEAGYKYQPIKTTSDLDRYTIGSSSAPGLSRPPSTPSKSDRFDRKDVRR